jgi:hypothetical protein
MEVAPEISPLPCGRDAALVWDRAEEGRPGVREHGQEGTLRSDHVITAIGVVIAQGRQDRCAGKPAAEPSTSSVPGTVRSKEARQL